MTRLFSADGYDIMRRKDALEGKGWGDHMRFSQWSVFLVLCLLASLPLLPSSAPADEAADGKRVWREASAVKDLAAALAAAKTEEERTALLDGKRELVTAELVQELLTQATLLLQRRAYTPARALYFLTQRIATQIVDKAGMAEALHGIASTYVSQGDYDRALQFYQQGLALRKELGDRAGVARTLHDIGQVSFWQGEYESALRFYQESRALHEALGEKMLTGHTINGIAHIHRLQGNYALALTLYHKALSLFEEERDRAMLGTLYGIASIHHAQGNYDLALQFYQKALPLYGEFGDSPGMARPLLGIGMIYREQGDYESALKFLHDALNRFEKWGYRTAIATTLSHIGDVHADRGDHVAALECFQKSLAHFDEMQEQSGTAMTLSKLSRVHYVQGNYTRARELAERAVALATQVGNPEPLWRAHFQAGEAYRARGQPVQARHAYGQAIAAIESLRVKVAGGDQERQRFFENKLLPYSAMVELLLAQNQTGDAFAYTERAKARALLDLLAERRVSVRTGAPPDLLQRERELMTLTATQALRLRELKMRRDASPETVKTLETKLLDNEAQLQVVQVQLRSSRYATLQYPQPLTVAEAQKLLPPDTALLAYYVMEDETALWVVTAHQIKVHRLKVTAQQLQEDIAAFRAPMEEGGKSWTVAAQKASRSLYQHLIAPARADLTGMRRLVIAPHRSLFYLPFAALEVDSKGKEAERGGRKGNGGRARYLIEDYAIVVVPSATVLRDIRNSKSQTPNPKSQSGTVLAFAPFAVGKSKSANPAIARRSADNGRQGGSDFLRSYYRDTGLKSDPLPRSEEEVRTVSGLFRPPGKSYVGAEATESRVKAESSGYRILHFATHGILDDRNPQYSGIALAEARNPKSQIPNPKSEDGFLQTQEIFNLTLNADLVVLSACETAFGKEKQSVKESNAEGFIGLTRGFLYAGTPTVVVSLWKVADESTSPLMIESYQQLVGGKVDKAEAMRRAQLKVRSKTPHPYFWAPFVLVGDWR